MFSFSRTKAASALLVAVIAVAAMFAFVISRNPRPLDFSSQPGPLAVSTKPARSPTSSSLSTPTLPPPSPAPAEPAPAEPAPTQKLDDSLSALKSVTTADSARKILADLRAYLGTLPPDLAAAAINRFLADPKNNAATRIAFSIGKTGFLDGHPSLRVALLDWLGEISPSQAGAMATQILATPTDADEWAVSLRNYARAYPADDQHAFLRTKTEELIRNPAWRVNPSVGFFESFDVLVHTRATASTAILSDLVADLTPEGKPLAYASFLTLDRLTLREPVAMMEQLATRPALTSVRGEMVANLFARADLRDPAQQHLVRSYLLDPTRTAAELTAFSGIYPNANFTVSQNLLSENMSLTGSEITTRDAAALEIVNTWLADPAFLPVKSHLTTMHQRLTTFVGQTRE